MLLTAEKKRENGILQLESVIAVIALAVVTQGCKADAALVETGILATRFARQWVRDTTSKLSPTLVAEKVGVMRRQIETAAAQSSVTLAMDDYAAALKSFMDCDYPAAARHAEKAKRLAA